MKFGIIGYGSFGRFLASALNEYGEVAVYTRHQEALTLTGIKFKTLEETAKSDVLILAVGLDALDSVSKRLSGLVSQKTIVVDVCSVKLRPIEILEKNLGGKCRILATHPLFGPQTAKPESIAGKKIVVCPSDFEGKDKIIDFLTDDLRLEVIEMPAEDHDKEMAWVHALTFFVGRGLMQLDPPPSKLTTGYYQKLLDLVELESTHSIELFNTVQKGNPFAARIRRDLIGALDSIDKELKG